MTVGERIRTRRKELHYTLEEVAKKVGTTKQTIQRYESGEITNIPYPKLMALADVLQCTGADFFEDNQNKYSSENAHLLNEIKNNSEYIDIIKFYKKLDATHQQLMYRLLKDMGEDSENGNQR